MTSAPAAVALGVSGSSAERRRRAQVTLAAVLVAARAVAVGWSGPVIVPDSERYRDVAHPWAPFEVWSGHGPGVLVQLVYLLPAGAAVVVQTLLAGACWSVAAVYVAGVAERPARSWLWFGLVTAWGLSPWFVVWDDWVMPEALTCGGCALAAVGLASWSRGRDSGVMVALAGLGVAVLTRPFVAALLVPLVVLVAWPAPRRVARRIVLGAGVLLGGFAAWQCVALATVDAMPYSYLPEPESLATVQATDRLAGRGDVPGYLALAREHGMPPCPGAETVVTGSADVYERVVQLRALTACPDLDAWLAEGGLPWTAELTDNTASSAHALLAPDYWLEDSVGHYVFASDRTLAIRDRAGSGWPDVLRAANLTMLASLACAVLAGLVLARRRRLLVLLATGWTAVFVVVSWAVDGMEYWRHVLPAFPVLALLCVTLVAVPGADVHGRRADISGARAAP